MKNLGRKELIESLVGSTHMSYVRIEQVLDTVLDKIKSSLGRGQRIELRKFGVWTVVPKKKGGVCRNPKTGAVATIKPGKVIRFRITSKF